MKNRLIREKIEGGIKSVVYSVTVKICLNVCPSEALRLSNKDIKFVYVPEAIKSL